MSEAFKCDLCQQYDFRPAAKFEDIHIGYGNHWTREFCEPCGRKIINFIFHEEQKIQPKQGEER